MVLLYLITYVSCLFITPANGMTCELLPPLWMPLGPCHLPGISSWGAQVAIGNATQQICITPSTVTNSTLLMAPSVCSEAQRAAENMTYPQCASRRGGFISFGTLPTASDAEQANLDDLNPGWMTIQGEDAFKSALTTALYLHGGVESNATMLDIVITDGRNHTTSQLALGNQSVLLDTLVSSKQIGRRSFGINVGSTSITNARSGSIVFGGYDSAAINGAFVEYPMTYSIVLNDRVCPLQVKIRQLTLRQPGLQDDVLFSEEWPLWACIEPYDNLFRLPDNLVNKNLVPTMERITGAKIAPPRPDPNMWINEPGLMFGFNGSSSFNGSLIFTLDQNFIVEIPSYEIVRPLRGLATNGSMVINDRFTELQVYPVEPLDAAVLGKIFLSQVYLHVDYDRQVFELANLNTDTNSILPVSDDEAMGAGCSATASRINPTTIAVAIGVNVGLLLLLAALIWVLLNRRKKQKRIPLAQLVTVPEDPKSENAPEIAAIEHPSTITPQTSTRGVAASPTAQVQPWTPNSGGSSLPGMPIHQQPDSVHQDDMRGPATTEMQGTSVNQGHILGELPSPSSDRQIVGGPISYESKVRTLSYASELSNEPSRPN